MYKLYMGFIKFKDYYLNQTGRVKNGLVGVTARLSALKWQLESLSIKKTGWNDILGKENALYKRQHGLL